MSLTLYVVKSNLRYDEDHAIAVVAESREEADRMIQSDFSDGFTDFSVQEFPVAKGMLVRGFGYDTAELSCDMPEVEG